MRASVLALAVTAAHSVIAQEADLEEVIITGTRRCHWRQRHARQRFNGHSGHAAHAGALI